LHLRLHIDCNLYKTTERENVVDFTCSGSDKIEQRLATLASMPGPPLSGPPLRRPDRPRSPPPPTWKPSQRLAAPPPPTDTSSRGNKSPIYRSKVVVPSSAELAASKSSLDRRAAGRGDTRPTNRSPVGDQSRDARRPVPGSSDRPSLQSRSARPAGDSVDHLRSSTTSGGGRDADRQGTSRGV